jgi:hypothetical protein
MSYKIRILFILITACFQLIGCNRQHPPVNPNPPVLKIAVMADGRIIVDGQPATIESLRESLKQLAQQKGVVWYYREAGQTPAPLPATEVIQAVIDNRLPIRLSSRPDYSDSVGIDGKPIAGKPAAN